MDTDDDMTEEELKELWHSIAAGQDSISKAAREGVLETFTIEEIEAELQRRKGKKTKTEAESTGEPGGKTTSD